MKGQEWPGQGANESGSLWDFRSGTKGTVGVLRLQTGVEIVNKGSVRTYRRHWDWFWLPGRPFHRGERCWLQQSRSEMGGRARFPNLKWHFIAVGSLGKQDFLFFFCSLRGGDGEEKKSQSWNREILQCDITRIMEGKFVSCQKKNFLSCF